MKKDHCGACNYIMENFQKGDKIFHTCKNTIPSFKYYFNSKNKLGGEPKQILLKFSEDSKRPLLYEFVIAKNTFELSKDNSIEKNKRVFLVFSSWEFTGFNRPELNMVECFDQSYKIIDEKRFKGIIVYLYSQVK